MAPPSPRSLRRADAHPAEGAFTADRPAPGLRVTSAPQGTAIHGLARLETPAIWRPEGEEPRAIYISIGEAELVILGEDEVALDHWSLPAMQRLDHGALPARYAPGPASGDTLEIDEAEMVDALDRVLAAVARGRQRPGRLRWAITVVLLAALIGGAAIWAPSALRRHAAQVIPPAQREEIGDRLLVSLQSVTGPTCGGLLGDEALAGLRTRLLPMEPVRMRVLRTLPVPALALPGALLLVSNETLLAQDDPAVAAGHVVATWAGARLDPPIDRFLRDIGTAAILRLLASGALPDRVYEGHVETLLAAPPPPPPNDALRRAFAEARLDWGPFAAATGRSPQGRALDMPPALDDTDWQSLRGICEA